MSGPVAEPLSLLLDLDGFKPGPLKPVIDKIKSEREQRQKTGRLRVGVLTAPRQGVSYVCATVASLARRAGTKTSFDLGLFADRLKGAAPDAIDQPCELFERSQEELDRIRTDELYGTLNLQRALRWGARGGDYTFVFEDDVVFANNWLQRALVLAKHLDASGKPWCLMLQHFLSVREFDVYRIVGSDALLRWREKAPIWGSQGYMLPSALALRVADELDEKFKIEQPSRRWWMMDEGMLRFASEAKLYTMYVTHPCLIEHVGAVSSVFDWEELRPGRMSRYVEEGL